MDQMASLLEQLLQEQYGERPSNHQLTMLLPPTTLVILTKLGGKSCY